MMATFFFYSLFVYSLSLISLFLLWSDPDFLLFWLYIPISSCWIVPVIMYVGNIMDSDACKQSFTSVRYL